MASGVRPVLRYPAPAYPDRDLVAADPGLLAREIPRRWIGRKGLAAALVAAALGTGGCATSVQGEVNIDRRARPVAVMFEHGAGRAYFACVSVVPAVFLSEEEARRVVAEELGKAGVPARPDSKTIPNIVRRREHVMVVSENNDPAIEEKYIEKGYVVREAGEEMDLLLDGYDEATGIGYEVVTEEDYRGLGGITCSGRAIDKCDRDMDFWIHPFDARDYREASKHLTEKLNGRGGRSAIGVFYVSSEQADGKQWEGVNRRINAEFSKVKTGDRKAFEAAAARARAEREVVLAPVRARLREDLRLQVRDFAAWLQAQGLLR